MQRRLITFSLEELGNICLSTQHCSNSSMTPPATIYCPAQTWELPQPLKSSRERWAWGRLPSAQRHGSAPSQGWMLLLLLLLLLQLKHRSLSVIVASMQTDLGNAHSGFLRSILKRPLVGDPGDKSPQDNCHIPT